MKKWYMKKWLWAVVAVIVLLVLTAYLGGGYIVYDRLSAIGSPDAKTMLNSPADFKVDDEDYTTFDTAPYEVAVYEAVKFPSRQAEISLTGWYMETDTESPAVIITHGLGSSKNDAKLLIVAGMLVNNGFNVLMYDMRNHGESNSDNGRVGVGNKEFKDLLGAWDYLVNVKGITPERIGLYGVSLGAGTSLMAFGQETRAAALFIDSPYFDLPEIMTAELVRNNYPTFLVTPALLVARISGENLLEHRPAEAIDNDNGRPICVVHGTGDTRISVNQTYELEVYAKENGANVTVWIPDGIEHVQGMLALTNEYEQRMVGFFKDSLK